MQTQICSCKYVVEKAKCCRPKSVYVFPWKLGCDLTEIVEHIPFFSMIEAKQYLNKSMKKVKYYNKYLYSTLVGNLNMHMIIDSIVL